MTDWRPIETAPRDGTSIVTVVAGFEPVVTEWREIDATARFCIDPEMFMHDDHFLEYFHEMLYEPTHWQPLPKSPEATR